MKLIMLLALTAIARCAQAEDANVIPDTKWGEVRCDLVSQENNAPCVAAHARLGIASDKTASTDVGRPATSVDGSTTKNVAEDSPEIARAKRIMEEGMIDPSSVQYKDVTYIQSTQAVCGLFNAKNRLGGYAGFARFTVGADGKAHSYDGTTSCSPRGGETQFQCLRRKMDDIKIIQSNCASVLTEDERGD